MRRLLQVTLTPRDREGLVVHDLLVVEDTSPENEKDPHYFSFLHPVGGRQWFSSKEVSNIVPMTAVPLMTIEVQE